MHMHKLTLLAWTTSSPAFASTLPTAVIGGGVAGLRCALALAAEGKSAAPVTVFESEDAVGGRVRSDMLDGFTLDRGFQVFLTAYPEVNDGSLDLPALGLGEFWPGAMVQLGDGTSTLVADPFRSPPLQTLVPTLTTPLGTLADKLRLVLAVLRLKLGVTLADVFAREELSTQAHLTERLQLSDALVDGFFRPFFRGIFLAPLAQQS